MDPHQDPQDDALTARFLPALKALPEGNRLLAFPASVAAWLRGVLALEHGDEDRVEAQIRRLGGIRPSEIGIAVAEKSGAADPWSSMHEIISRKLMEKLPARPTADMQIAFAMQAEARRRVFSSLRKFGCVRDDAALSSLESGASPRPWMIGGARDVIFLGEGQSTRRYVLDYRVSMFGAEESHEVLSRDIYRVHQQRLMLAHRGVRIDGMLIAKLQRDAAGFFQLALGDVPHDPAKDAEILAAGDHYWAMRCRGEIPEMPARPSLPNLGDQRAERLRHVGDEFAAYQSIAKHAYRLAAGKREQLTSMLAGVHLPDSAVVGAAAVSVVRTFDPDLAVTRLGPAAEVAATPVLDSAKVLSWMQQNGIDAAPFVTGRVFDQGKLAAELLTRGVDMAEVSRVSIKVDVDGRRRGLKDLAAQAVGSSQVSILDAAQQGASNEPQRRSAGASPGV